MSFDDRDRRYMRLLVSGEMTKKEAAEKAGIPTRRTTTLHRDEDFEGELQRLRHDIDAAVVAKTSDQVAAALREHREKAVEALPTVWERRAEMLEALEPNKQQVANMKRIEELAGISTGGGGGMQQAVVVITGEAIAAYERLKSSTP